MTNSLTIEKANAEVTSKLELINYIIRTSSTKLNAFERLRYTLSNEIELGYGSNHIWCSDQDERLFIITGY